MARQGGLTGEFEVGIYSQSVRPLRSRLGGGGKEGRDEIKRGETVSWITEASPYYHMRLRETIHQFSTRGRNEGNPHRRVMKRRENW